MKKAALSLLVVSALGLSACQSEKVEQKHDPLLVEQVALETDQQKQAYAIGTSIGGFINKQVEDQKSYGIELDKALLVQGFVAALQGQSQFTEAEARELVAKSEQAIRAAKQKEQNMVGEKNIADGAAYLAENAKREGVTVTESGLQYEVLTAAEGDKPAATDTVKVHYHGTLLDGTEFDSSYTRGEPAVFPLNRVIKGWTEGVQLMSVGSKYKFHIPSELAYGQRATGKITPNSTLIFDVELLEIVKPQKPVDAE